jgi:hypothetical protein
MAATALHGCIEKYNVLEAPTISCASFFDRHPTAYKVALIFMHLFRAAALVGIMFIPNLPLSASMPICFVGSLIYRIIVEKNCPYKFALPSFAGAAAVMIALPSLLSMINGTAFLTAASGTAACAAFLPLIAYGTYITLTVSYDVDANKARCCCSKNGSDA